MALSPRTRLGPYEVLALIGAGGMGEVYKAHDPRLGRDVAVKVCAEQFSERFEREARAIAALNHPNICQIYDVGPNYIVMELIDGQPLKGPLPLAQALKYAGQICDALDAAHRKNITHRDLKPGNILVTKSGLKLLDFGLAKQIAAPGTDDATKLTPLTGDGAILGTLQYMSPEQLEGKEAHPRSDIFAFGAVLYEMVSGKRAFEGQSQASVIASILERDPPSIADIAPAALDRAMRRCLEKDAEDRWQTARDLKAELAWVAEGGAPLSAGSAPSGNPWRERAAWLLAVTLVGVGVFAAMRSSRTSGAGEAIRLSVNLPEKATFSGPDGTTSPVPQFALSPDGGAIVFAGNLPGVKPMLWLRSMDDVVARPLQGTDNASLPFWSPDGRWIAFFSESVLKKIPAAGGAVQVLAKDLGSAYGGSWGPDDTILFGSSQGGLFRVASAGGAVTPATVVSTTRNDATHRWPHFLPDGRHFVFTVRGKPEYSGIYLGSLDAIPEKRLLSLESNAIYVPPGYLLYVEGDKLVGQAFDADRFALSDKPLVIAERVGRSSTAYGSVSASRSGMLAYAGAIQRPGRLTWFDRGGKVLGTAGADGDYIDFRLSPNEQRLAVSLVDAKAGNIGIWLIDLARGGTTPLIISPNLSASAIWSPDGSRLAFRADPRGRVEIYQQSAAGGGNPEAVVTGEVLNLTRGRTRIINSDWSPDGRYILLSILAPASGWDLWLLPVGGDGKPVLFLGSPLDQNHGNFSPDGRLVAYTSNESGRHEVYVQTFPLTDRKWSVSTNGGTEPRWRRDGREVYYLAPDGKLMAVSVGTGPSFDVPRVLFQTQLAETSLFGRTRYVPSNDGQRFLINTPSETPANPITVVLNWTAGLKK